MVQKVYMIQKAFVCTDYSKGLHLDRSYLIQKAFSFAGMIQKVYIYRALTRRSTKALLFLLDFFRVYFIAFIELEIIRKVHFLVFQSKNFLMHMNLVPPNTIAGPRLLTVSIGPPDSSLTTIPSVPTAAPMAIPPTALLCTL